MPDEPLDPKPPEEEPGSASEPQPASGEPPAGEDVGGGLLSQEDINAALSGVQSASTPQESQPPSTGAPPPTSAGSPQDEIDALLAAADSLADTGNEKGEPGSRPEASEEVLLDSAGRPFDEAAAAMAAAIAEDAAAQPGDATAKADGTAAQDQSPEPLDLEDFSARGIADGPHDISMLRDVNLKVHIELGRTHMYIEDVLKLTEGSVVELDNLAGDPVNVYVNDRLVARGEVLVLSDNFCVRISEILTGPQHVAVA